MEKPSWINCLISLFITLSGIYNASTMSSYHLSTHSLRVRIPQFFMHTGISNLVQEFCQAYRIAHSSLMPWLAMDSIFSISPSCIRSGPPVSFIIPTLQFLATTWRRSTAHKSRQHMHLRPPDVFIIAFLLFHCLLCSGTVPTCEGL